jgi:hypothetical protein
MADKLHQLFLEMLHRMREQETMYAFTFRSDKSGKVVRVTSKVGDVQRVPNTLEAVYHTFPAFLLDALECNEAPDAWCRVEQTLWWDAEGSFRVSSVVRGSYGDLVLKAIQPKPE